MNVILLLGLTIQTFAICLIFYKVGKNWFSHLGVLFALMAFLLHGVTELLDFLFPAYKLDLSVIADLGLESWFTTVSVGLLCFTFGYAFFVKPTTQVAKGEPKENPFLSQNDLPLVPVLILFVYCLINLGIAQSRYTRGDTSIYVQTSITNSFYIYSIVILTLKFLAQSRGRYLLLALSIMCIFVAIFNSRTHIPLAVVLCLSTWQRYSGIKLPKGTWTYGVLVTMLLMVLVASTRSFAGRDELTATSVRERVAAFTSGSRELVDRANSDQAWFLDQFVAQFDGNIFPSLVALRLEQGYQPIGIHALNVNLILLVPSTIYPEKLNLPLIYRNVENAVILMLGLPQTDYYPTFFGILYAAYGRFGLWVISFFLGISFALLDNYLNQFYSRFRLLIGLGLGFAIMYMTGGTTPLFNEIRSVLILFILILAYEYSKKLVLRRYQKPAYPLNQTKPIRNQATP